jgi:hypothetical protein
MDFSKMSIGTQADLDNARHNANLIPYMAIFIGHTGEIKDKKVCRSYYNGQICNDSTSVAFEAEDGSWEFTDSAALSVVEEEIKLHSYKDGVLWLGDDVIYEPPTTKFPINWESIDGYTFRSKVFGGWLVKVLEDVVHLDSPRHSNSVNGYDWRVAMTFVPDPEHEWTV